jgi:hypothetical protein
MRTGKLSAEPHGADAFISARFCFLLTRLTLLIYYTCSA